jgi:23S rRNA (adenine2503-C2)-methyltransferase
MPTSRGAAPDRDTDRVARGAALSRATAHAAGIKSLDPAGLGALVGDLGQPRYRAAQLATWLYHRGAGSYDDMSDIPAPLRAELAEKLVLPRPEIVERRHSSDGTRKYLIRFADGVSVEAVGLPEGARLTVCYSTQAGCAMKCAFCATGQAGFTRDLGPGEMVDQVRLVGDDFCARVTNAVAMGQGEPFANYEATLGALRFLNSRKTGLGIGARHLTVSTCGIVDGIRRFAEEPEQFTLAVSLHSAVQETRDRLMPGVRGVPLPALRSAIAGYVATTNRRPTLEYALIDGVNDTDVELAALAAFTRGMLVHVNLIPVNPVAGSGFARSTSARAHLFVRTLGAQGTEASLRVERGADIDAACGQLKQRFGAEEPAPDV